MKAIRVKDLRDPSGVMPTPFLHCAKCGNRYSAHKGDYFQRSPESVFKCCGRNMALVTEHTTFERVAV